MSLYTSIKLFVIKINALNAEYSTQFQLTAPLSCEIIAKHFFQYFPLNSIYPASILKTNTFHKKMWRAKEKQEFSNRNEIRIT